MIVGYIGLMTFWSRDIDNVFLIDYASNLSPMRVGAARPSFIISTCMIGCHFYNWNLGPVLGGTHLSSQGGANAPPWIFQGGANAPP